MIEYANFPTFNLEVNVKFANITYMSSSRNMYVSLANSFSHKKVVVGVT